MLSKKISIFFLVCLFLFVCMFHFCILGTAFSSDYLYLLLSCNVLATIIFFFTCDDINIKSYYYRPFCVFILGYAIVYFQRYVDLALGLINVSDSIFLKEGLIIKSLSYSTIGYLSLLLGYLSYFAKSNCVNNSSCFWIDLSFIRKVYYMSFVLFLLFKAKDLVLGSYTQEELENNAGGLSNYSGILFIVSYFSLLSVSVYNINVKGNISIRSFCNEFGFSCIIIALIATLLYLVSGSRSHPFLVICSFLFAICYLLKLRISLVKLVALLVIGSSIFSFIGATRNLQSDSVRDKMQAYELRKNVDKTIMPTTVELSGSLSTFLYSIDYVPTAHDYLYGSFHLRNLLSTIPFSSRFTSQFLDSQKKYHSSDFFVTYIIQGENYTYGNGTSINADLYLNYGILGILIGMFLLGHLMRMIEYSSYLHEEPSFWTILFLMYLAGYALIYVRNGFLAPINFIAFSSILNYYSKSHYRVYL